MKGWAAELARTAFLNAALALGILFVLGVAWLLAGAPGLEGAL